MRTRSELVMVMIVFLQKEKVKMANDQYPFDSGGRRTIAGHKPKLPSSFD